MPLISSDVDDTPISRKPRKRQSESKTCDEQKITSVENQDIEETFCLENGIPSKLMKWNKRPLEPGNTPPAGKRTRVHRTSTPKSNRKWKSTTRTITRSRDKLSRKSDITSESSCHTILPTIPGQRRDWNAVNAQTLAAILDGHYAKHLKRSTIIDCRHPDEFKAGHIRSAVNLYTKEALRQFLDESSATCNQLHVLIFYCESSTERAPDMLGFLRSMDTERNNANDSCPSFPEIYILDGGFSAFFKYHMHHCFPRFKNYDKPLHGDVDRFTGSSRMRAALRIRV